MQVRRLAARRRDRVHVDVEDRRREGLRSVSPTPPCLPQGRRERVVLAVVVAAELQPAVEPAVAVQQHLAAPRVDQERVAGRWPGS